MFNPFEHVEPGDEDEDLFLDFAAIKRKWLQAPPTMRAGDGGWRTSDNWEPLRSPAGKGFVGALAIRGNSASVAGASRERAANATPEHVHLDPASPAGADRGVSGSRRASFDRRRTEARSGPDGRRLVRDDEFWRKPAKGGGSSQGVAATSARIAVGQLASPPVSGGSSLMFRTTALASGAQAAVVKVVSVGGGLGSASAMVNYNSREGKEPLETETGERLLTRADHRRMLDDWAHSFDKREPSKDVVTLTARFTQELDDDAKAVFKAAVEAEYREQRIVSGFREGEGGSRFVAVLTIASRNKGRIKTTEHALEAVRRDLEGRLSDFEAIPALSYGKAVHGVPALAAELKAAFEAVGALSGPRDARVEAGNAGIVSGKWTRDLRSYGNRDVMHVVVSAKAGTDEGRFVDAVRDFLGEEFRDRRYAFALHGPHDETIDRRSGESKATDHVHAHVMILMKGADGRKLNPNIADLKRWRERMAFHAREHGIAMVATSRSESVNAPPFTKGQHAMVKAGTAPAHVSAKVAAKVEGRPVAPKRGEGRLNAASGRQAFRALMREHGDGAIGLEAARFAMRFDEAVGQVRTETIAAQRVDEAGGLLLALQALSDVITCNQTETLSMATRQTMAAQIERLDATFAKLSESLRGDSGLREALDAKVRPILDGMKDGVSFERGRAGEDLSSAVRARNIEALPAENAEAMERQARASGDNPAHEPARSDARTSRSQDSRAESEAAAAQSHLHDKGNEKKPSAEAVGQTAEPEENRPDTETAHRRGRDDKTRGRKR